MLPDMVCNLQPEFLAHVGPLDGLMLDLHGIDPLLQIRGVAFDMDPVANLEGPLVQLYNRHI